MFLSRLPCRHLYRLGLRYMYHTSDLSIIWVVAGVLLEKRKIYRTLAEYFPQNHFGERFLKFGQDWYFWYVWYVHMCVCVYACWYVCVFHFSVLNRVLEPSIIMEMTLSNGTTKAFEVRPKILMRVMLDKWINSMISSALWLLSLKCFLFWNFPWLLSVKKSSYFATLGGCFT